MPEPRFPLEVAFCGYCSLVQLTASVPPERLFHEYFYFSSFADTAVQNAKEIANRLTAHRGLDSDSFVIELASNDGYLLRHYQDHGVPVLGIEPAVNIAKVAQDRGVPTLNEFFNLELGERLHAADTTADIVHANNVLAHVPDLNGFVAGIARILKPSGLAVIEVPYVMDLIDLVEFDTIYHEHLCYFSLIALDRVFQRQGLKLVDAERIPIHGGSLRLFVQHGAVRTEQSSVLKELLLQERAKGLDRIDYFKDFAGKVENLRENLLGVLRELKGQGKRIAAYGASAKGSTLLNYFGVGRETLDFVVDRSTAKQGFYTPGTHLPIFPPEQLLREMPDYVLLLVWNFADEVITQQHDYCERGGHFIVPIPEVHVA